METLTTNKRFINICTILGGLLALFVFVLIVNSFKEGRYIGRGQGGVNTITVSANADIMAIPDIAVINVNLENEGKTSKDASAGLNVNITKTLEYLKSQKIDDKDIKSEYGGVNPKYDYGQVVCMGYPCPTKSPTIIGYTATQSITIKVRASDNANEIRTGLTNIGITNIVGPTFSIDDEDVLKDQARAKAINIAREKAEILANQLDVKLGDVVNFSENSGGYPMMYATKAMDMSIGSAMPERAPELPKGENKITSNVTITYEIR